MTYNPHHFGDMAAALASRFHAVRTIQQHLAIVDEADVQRQIKVIRRERPELWRELLKPAVDASWKRARTPTV